MVKLAMTAPTWFASVTWAPGEGAPAKDDAEFVHKARRVANQRRASAVASISDVYSNGGYDAGDHVTDREHVRLYKVTRDAMEEP